MEINIDYMDNSEWLERFGSRISGSVPTQTYVGNSFLVGDYDGELEVMENGSMIVDAVAADTERKVKWYYVPEEEIRRILPDFNPDGVLYNG